MACTGHKRDVALAFEPLDTFLNRCRRLGFSGVVLVRKGDSVALHNAYGLADREHGIANNLATQFRIGSLHKQFVAAAILRLEVDGELRTTDRISRYLGTLPEPKIALRFTISSRTPPV